MTAKDGSVIVDTQYVAQEALQKEAQASPGHHLDPLAYSGKRDSVRLDDCPEEEEDISDAATSSVRSYSAPLPALERSHAMSIIRKTFSRDPPMAAPMNFTASNTNVDEYPLQETSSCARQETLSCDMSEDTIAPEELPHLEALPGLDPPVTQPRQFLDGRLSLFKAVFITVTCSAQFLGQAQFGMVVIPLIEIGQYLGTTSPGELSWMAASNGWVAFC